MSEVPETVLAALEAVPVDGVSCLEAGAGAGNATAALRRNGARRVYAITNDGEHATGVRERFADDDAVTAIRGDLRAIPLPDGAVHVVTAHALCNVVPTTDLADIVDELTRVTAPGGYLVVDDYSPLPPGPVRDLFAVANAVGELDAAAPTFTFYPREHLRGLLEGLGWRQTRTKTLLDPVPWTADLLDAHLELILDRAGDLPGAVGDPLADRARTVRDRAGDGIETGEMYSLAFRLPE